MALSALVDPLTHDDILDRVNLLSSLTHIAPEHYGAVGNGVTDDTTALTAAYADCLASGKPMFLANKRYLTGNFGSNSSANFTIKGDGATLVAKASIMFESAYTTTLALASDMVRDARVLPLVSATGVVPGSLISVYTSVIAETDRNRTKQQTFTVVSVSGNNVTVAEPAKFNFLTADTGKGTYFIAAPRKIVFDGVNVGSTSALASTPLYLFGCRYSRLSNMDITLDDSDVKLRDGLLLESCVDTEISSISGHNARYVILSQQSNRTFVRDMRCNFSRHAVVPSHFSIGTYVDGLAGEGNDAIMDSHEAFETHYRRVITHSDAEMSNNRSCGGSVLESHFECLAAATLQGPMQNINFVAGDKALYQQHDFTMRDVHWADPLGLFVSGGRLVTLENVRLPRGKALDLGSSSAYLLNNAVVRNVDYDNDTTSGVIRVPVNAVSAVVFGCKDAVLTTGVYHIRPSNFGYVVPPRAYAKGNIFAATAVSTEPTAISVRIYTDPTPNYNGYAVPRALGLLKLRVTVDHTNAGVFDVLEHHYHFVHKKTATTGIEFPLTPAFVSALTGQTNESLAMALTNPTQVTADLTIGRNHYVQFDLSISSGRANPKYTLWYELDIYGAEY